MRPSEPRPLSRARVYAAVAAELLPGVAFIAALGLALRLNAEDHFDPVLALAMLALLSGLGWGLLLRLGTGCIIFVLRVAAGAVLFALSFQAFGNESSCYQMLDGDECWANAVRNYNVVLVVFGLMPVGSAVLLWRAARRHPWRREAPWWSPTSVRSAGRGVTAGLVVLIAAPALAGWLFDRSSIGEASLAVVNDTGEVMLASFSPLHAPGEYIDPGERRTLRPLVHRFDAPRTVTFAVGGADGVWTYWECRWGQAKLRQPLVINDANDAPCRKSTADPRDHGDESAP